MKSLLQHPVLTALFLLQLLCMAFLLTDAFVDIMGWQTSRGIQENDTLEYLVVLALVGSLIYSASQLVRLMRRNRAVEEQLQLASGAFHEVLQDHFEQWELTKSEADVATLAIKGLGIAEISSLRDTREGTVKAQLNAIYRKAGVTGRPQLISLFVEELMGESITTAATN